jgi:hypothetical protein
VTPASLANSRTLKTLLNPASSNMLRSDLR